MRSLGLVGACAGLAAFARFGRLCALAGGRFCWACGRVWSAVGGRLLALLLGLIGACGCLDGRFCWAHHVWAGAFAGLLLLGLWALLLGLWGWTLGAFAGLWALAGALGRFCRACCAGLGSCGCFCCLGALVDAFAGLVAVGVCRRFCRACGRLWAFLGLWALSLGLQAPCGRLWALLGLWALSLGLWALLLGLRALARSCWWTMPQRSQLLQDDEDSSGRSQTWAQSKCV